MNIQQLALALAFGLTLPLTACGKSAPTPAAPPPAVAVPTEAKPADEAKPAEAKPAEAKPADEAKPAEAKPADDAKPDDAKPADDAEPAELKAGDPAPDVTLKLTDGSQVALSSLRGQRVLVYFYPKDDTPGCTAEAQGIRDAWPQLQAAGVHVYGVSMQDADSHKAFIDKYALPFPLAIDDGTVAAAFQVPLRFGLTARQSFLIGADGKLEHVWREVDAGNHAADVLAVVR